MAEQKQAQASSQKKRKLVKGRHRSAIKRHRQSLKRAERNQSVMSELKNTMKKVLSAVQAKNKAGAETSLREVMSQLSRAATKKIVHRGYASRQTSRLSSLVSSLQS